MILNKKPDKGKAKTGKKGQDKKKKKPGTKKK